MGENIDLKKEKIKIEMTQTLPTFFDTFVYQTISKISKNFIRVCTKLSFLYHLDFQGLAKKPIMCSYCGRGNLNSDHFLNDS